jgi:hypothetical protein
MPLLQLRTPRLLEPLAAALIGAGSFLFLAAVSGLGPFGIADQAAWRLAQPGDALVLANTAVRVEGGGDSSLAYDARYVRLADQVAWLRKQGAGTIALEAWFDDAPQAEAKAMADDLRLRMSALPRAVRNPALKAISAAASTLDQDERLAASLATAQPLVLAYATRRGADQSVPPDLLKQGYEVTLRGRRQALSPRRVERLPYPSLLAAVARSGAVSLDDSLPEAVPATVELQNRWYDSLGLENARLALGVPLEGLRYRWHQGHLSSLELKGVRFPLDEEGRLRIPENLPQLPDLNFDSLQRDPHAVDKLKGKAVFFRPWPEALSDAGAFDAQERLFAAVVERDVLVPSPGLNLWLLWVLCWALGLGCLAWLPLWAGLPLWAVPVALLLQGFSQETQALAQPLTLALSALAVGLGWRLQIYRGKRAEADRRFHGHVAPHNLLDWARRLPLKGASHLGTFAVLSPAKLSMEAAFEAWLRQHNAFLDPDLGPSRLGIFIPGAEGEAWSADQVQELRLALPGAAVAAVPGLVSFAQGQRLGALTWALGGLARQEALALAEWAQRGQFLILERDYAPWHGKLKIQLTGQSLGEGSKELKVLNIME